MSQKFQIQNSFSTLEILKVEPSGVGEPIPLWRVKRNDFQNWKIGRLYIESDFDYRVRRLNKMTSKNVIFVSSFSNLLTTYFFQVFQVLFWFDFSFIYKAKP